MLSQTQLAEIRQRLTTEESGEAMRADTAALLTEVERLQRFVLEFGAQVTSKVDALEVDMHRLDTENSRLRAVAESTYFERDACIGLICRMAVLLGIRVGVGRFDVMQENMDGRTERHLQNRVVVDLPGGQVSWDFLDDEAHLFDWLPPYEGSLEAQTVQQNYSKVMNPMLETPVRPSMDV